jgi:flagellar motor switch protein FliN/FliY
MLGKIPSQDYKNKNEQAPVPGDGEASPSIGEFDPSLLQQQEDQPQISHQQSQMKNGAYHNSNGETLGQGHTYLPRNLDFILDIPLEISVELGRTRIQIADILKLGQGSIIELSNTAGSALEVLVNHKPIAKGEVVVVNEKYGIRLTEILSVMERIEKLR